MRCVVVAQYPNAASRGLGRQHTLGDRGPCFVEWADELNSLTVPLMHITRNPPISHQDPSQLHYTIIFTIVLQNNIPIVLSVCWQTIFRSQSSVVHNVGTAGPTLANIPQHQASQTDIIPSRFPCGIFDRVLSIDQRKDDRNRGRRIKSCRFHSPRFPRSNHTGATRIAHRAFHRRSNRPGLDIPGFQSYRQVERCSWRTQEGARPRYRYSRIGARCKWGGWPSG